MYNLRPTLPNTSGSGSSGSSVTGTIRDEVKKAVADSNQPVSASANYNQGKDPAENLGTGELTPTPIYESYEVAGDSNWYKTGDDHRVSYQDPDDPNVVKTYSENYGWHITKKDAPGWAYFTGVGENEQAIGWASLEDNGSFKVHSTQQTLEVQESTPNDPQVPGGGTDTTDTTDSGDGGLSDAELSRQDYKKATEESMETLKGDITSLESASKNLDIVNNPDDYDRYLRIDATLKKKRKELLLAQQLVGDIDTKKFQRDADGDIIKDEQGNPIEEDKWDIQDLALMVGLMGTGATFADSIFSLFDNDETEPINAKDEIIKATEATTDPVAMDMILDASYRDMPRVTDLEQLTSYRNTFGSLSGDYFNTEYGPELESKYQEWVQDNPYGNRDQFLVDWSETNPTNPLAISIKQQLSQLGQMDRSGKILAEMDSGLIRDGMTRAKNFYKPTEIGGMGFRPGDFRTNEQAQLVNKTMGLANDSGLNQVKQNIGSRINTGGRMGADEVRDITASSLTSVDSSLANQAYLRNGGLSRAVLNNSTAQRNRLREDEASMLGVVQAQQSFMPTANSIVASNTINPVTAFGMPGSQSDLAGQIFNNTPTGQNYDPTSAFMSSIIGANANIAQANSMNPSALTEFGNTMSATGEFINAVGDYNNRNKTISDYISS